MMGEMVVLVVLAVSLLQGSFGDEIRGIHPSKKQFYGPRSDFTCLDGSATIPFSLVNDDYCDCKDGSDEPGTSACPNGRFYCANKGHRSLNLLSSRVNDKICDCCDGSDEWGTEDVTCPNTCEDMGKQAKEDQRQRRELHMQGHAKRQNYVTQGKQKEQDSRVQLAQKEAELELLHSEVEQLATVKDTAEEPEIVAKDEHRRKWEEEKESKRIAARREEAQFGFDELDSNSDGLVSVDELRIRYELDDDSDGEVSDVEVLDYLDNQESVNFDAFYPTVWDKIADKCQFRRPPPPPLPIDSPEKVEESDLNRNEEEYDEDEDDEDDDEDEDEDDIHPSEERDEEMPEYDDKTKELIAAADAARAAHREAESKKSSVEREITRLKKYLEIDYGPDREFSTMYDQCYEFTDREYIYKMCAFKKVTQTPKNGGRETNLGTWGKWNGPPNNLHSVMVYEDGEKCWNGPSRSATVTIVCGLEDKLLSASEPNRCEYTMDFSTPAVCTPITHTTHEEL